MDRLTLLVVPADETAGFCFEKIAGLPLLLRNLLTLDQAGYKGLGLCLPKQLIPRFQREIQPALKARKLAIEILPFNKIEKHQTLAANLLIDKHHPFLSSLKIDTPTKLRKAEKALLEEIRLSTPGSVAKHLNKRISLPISLFVARFGIHPNWITLFNLILGYSTGFLVAQGTYTFYLYGALLFQMVSIIDGCDGEVAKLTFKTSKFGQYFDSLSDNGALISFFIGLVVAYAKVHSLVSTLSLGLFLILGLGGLLWQMIHFLKKYTNSGSLVTFDKEYLAKLPYPKTSFLMRLIHLGKTLMRKDCFSLFFFLSSLVGWLPYWLYLTIAGTWIANAILLYLKLQPKPQPRYEGASDV